MTSKATYNRTSLYAKTPLYGEFLDMAQFPKIPKLADDVLFTVNKTYQNRPDLLAFDLYGDANLWWVFALRNPNTLKDSIFDFKLGVRIYLPKGETVTSVLGM